MKKATSKRKSSKKLSTLERIEQWLAAQQLLVLVFVVILIMSAGIVVSRHEAFLLGELTGTISSTSEGGKLPEGIFENVNFGFFNNVNSAGNVPRKDLENFLGKMNSLAYPIFMAENPSRIEDVFVTDAGIWTLKADAVDPAGNFFDIYITEYEEINRARIQRTETAMMIPLDNKPQFIALMAGNEPGVIQTEGTFAALENMPPVYETSILGAPAFMGSNQNQFLDITFTLSGDEDLYGMVTVTPSAL